MAIRSRLRWVPALAGLTSFAVFGQFLRFEFCKNCYSGIPAKNFQRGLEVGLIGWAITSCPLRFLGANTMEY